MADTLGELHSDWLLRPWLVRTYHDLFRNVGFRVRSEDVFRGAKNDVERECLVTLYEKPGTGAA
ncbi:MAG TPA: hypothetical protein VD866_06250 [Urbifossiella sp.]|nr:hypothetical protein [Urbifossiella sp.]